MQILVADEIVFGRFRVVALVNGAGQSFGYRAVDLRAPEHKPWLRDIYLKQFHDLIPGTDEARALGGHFNALQDRLGERAGYIGLPLEFGEAGNSVVAAYPWIQGMTLRNRLESGLTHEECVRLAMAVTKSIRMMHKKGVAHLDLKPDNVVVQEGRRDDKLYVRMIDLDAAQIDGVGLRRSVIGTDGYMSPEHYWPSIYGPVSWKSDIFALGIMLFELLFHRHPFLVDDGPPYSEAIQKGEVEVPENEYHKNVVGKIIDCLSVSPNRRPQAGWVQATLTEHYEVGLKTEREEDRWFIPKKRRLFVQLDGLGDASGFRRTYFETVDLRHNEFRGLRYPGGVGCFLRISFDDFGCTLLVLTSGVSIELEGRLLAKNDRVRLHAQQELKLGNSALSVKLIDY